MDRNESTGAPVRVLFVCMGNICRSPLAEGVFRHKAAERGFRERFVIDSAGTGDWHAGQPADARMRAVAAAHGVALEGVARPVDPDDFRRFDHILCADRQNLETLLEWGAPPERTRLLLDYDPDAGHREVPDPYFDGAEGFELVYRLVDRACDRLLDELLAGRDPR